MPMQLFAPERARTPTNVRLTCSPHGRKLPLPRCRGFARTRSPVQASGGGARNAGGKQMRGLLSWGGARFVWSSWIAIIGVMIATGETVAVPGEPFQQASDGIVA